MVLAHSGLVMPYDDIKQGQHYAWCPQAITSTSVDYHQMCSVAFIWGQIQIKCPQT